MMISAKNLATLPISCSVTPLATHFEFEGRHSTAAIGRCCWSSCSQSLAISTAFSQFAGRRGTDVRGAQSAWIRASFGPAGGYSALSPDLKESLDKYLKEHKVVLFMKGNRMFPQCGFSNTVIQILNQCNVSYETVNILENDSIRQGVKEYSSWPTFPQLYIDGEFFGGCDITVVDANQLSTVTSRSLSKWGVKGVARQSHALLRVVGLSYVKLKALSMKFDYGKME